jgi:hypothetical protein
MSLHIVSMPRPHGRRLSWGDVAWSVVLIVLTTTGCAIRQEFPMRNTVSGEKLSCYTPYTYIMIGELPYQIGLRCIEACRRHSFEYVGLEHLGPMSDDLPFPITDEMIRPQIPPACLP